MPPRRRRRFHPVLGTFYEEDSEPAPAAALAPPERLPEAVVVMPAPPLTPTHRRAYCEDCGVVDGHAEGCPRLDALEALREPPAPPPEPAEPEVPSLRRIAAGLLRRLAKKLDG